MKDENIKIYVEPAPEAAARRAADLFISLTSQTGGGNKFYFALAGGNTPSSMYEILSRRRNDINIPWADMEVFFGDERNVPKTHERSNYRMARRSLLDHVPIPPQQVHPMDGDANDLSMAAEKYEQSVRDTVPADNGSIPSLDLVMLGMGTDGHVASLFPDTEALDEDEKLVLAHFVPALRQWRMTFTFPLINAARNVLMLVTGRKKAPAVAKLLSENEFVREKLPAARVKPLGGKLHIILDSAARRK